jgi:transcription termination factor Rho
MTERRRPFRRGRGRGPRNSPAGEGADEANPYREGVDDAPVADAAPPAPADVPPPSSAAPAGLDAAPPSAPSYGDQGGPNGYEDRGGRFRNNGRGRFRRGRRGRRQWQDNGAPGAGEERGPRRDAAPPQVVADTTVKGWFQPNREAGFLRQPQQSYLAVNGDPFVPPHLVRQHGIRHSDLIEGTAGRDHRGRLTVAELTTINARPVGELPPRTEFQSLTATYPDRRLTLETGRPAKGGHELTRRAIDLIAPIGYGQRALIVAPARAGKTTLLHAITEGIALNHPEAVLLILLVDERPEEVSEAISWGVGEVVASSFDQPAARHVEVTEMVLEHARRQVELGKDVIIVLDSLTRMARAHNTAERGTGRTLSGGLDSSAMAKPKAFFGSARAIAAQSGGGSLTIIATALVETGSRMDDVIFEEFKGTGNCEIKLDRSLAEKRIFPAFDIAASGTRREEKLYKAEQIEAIYTLRRGLQQMPPQAAMEWMIKRIAATTSNDALLAGL